MTLEVEFNKNPTPTALVRERIAQEINMTERSVQIWFQNRYARNRSHVSLRYLANTHTQQARQDQEHCKAVDRERRGLR